MWSSADGQTYRPSTLTFEACTNTNELLDRFQNSPRLTEGAPVKMANVRCKPKPIKVLFSKERGAKNTNGYVTIFVCLAVKAIHIEIVSDLTFKAFLVAYDRFNAKRGACSCLYSDNATTFKGAAMDLKQLFTETSEFVKDIKGQLAMQGTKWSFIPPRAPHFGGIWEAALKSFKHHYTRIVGESALTFKEHSTLAAKIESCLNSRPIGPLSTDPSEPAALTSGHFLVGTSCLTPPEPVNL
ncbi:uncharacterized protein LOC106644174 [Copidosoma floridanum]|uniref:uncharacterized protein LOC106644174 n=1 Tax=Copidosoma floridanum TaxID=29053 RepID=UPI0006C9C3F0|nr:uncharacterized protein LOC106644174 [Copidosoma floridanum]